MYHMNQLSIHQKITRDINVILKTVTIMTKFFTAKLPPKTTSIMDVLFLFIPQSFPKTNQIIQKFVIILAMEKRLMQIIWFQKVRMQYLEKKFLVLILLYFQAYRSFKQEIITRQRIFVSTLSLVLRLKVSLFIMTLIHQLQKLEDMQECSWESPWLIYLCYYVQE